VRSESWIQLPGQALPDNNTQIRDLMPGPDQYRGNEKLGDGVAYAEVHGLWSGRGTTPKNLGHFVTESENTLSVAAHDAAGIGRD